jgi:acetyltransferase-like isoleucine patch superfamily enzyme
MKLPSYLLRSINRLRVAILIFRGITIEEDVFFYGRPIINRFPKSTIKLGKRVVICSDSEYTALALNHPTKISTLAEGALISIGHDTGISGATIICVKSVNIGVKVLLGANVVIVDTDFHPIDPQGRRHSDDISKIGVAPVEIGDNVFIGTGAIILKGSKIGKDSIVAAGAIVTGIFDEGVIIAGNPGKVIGSVYRE